MSFKILSISIIFSGMVLGNLPSVIKTGGGQKKMKDLPILFRLSLL